LNYHAQALRLFGREPRISESAVRTIERHEALGGFVLPAAVREWYTLEGAEEMLSHREEAGGPTPLAGILKAFGDFASAPAGRKPPRVNFYGPRRANTGYDADLIPDGSDDPPVFIDLEEREQPFSRYVLDVAWWKATLDDVPSIHVGGRDWWCFAAGCGPAQLKFLAERFEELPREPHPFLTWAFDQPELRGFRFFRGDWRVAVATRGDPTAGTQPAAYDLSADTEAKLFDLYQLMTPCHGVALHLCPPEGTSYAEMKGRFSARFLSAEVCR
jgi:hypothetical protein